MKAQCPKDPTHQEFIATATVGEDWKVNSDGRFLELVENQTGYQIINEPLFGNGNEWVCSVCGETAIEEGLKLKP